MEEYLEQKDMMFQRDDKKQLLPVDIYLKNLEKKKAVNQTRVDPDTGEELKVGVEMVVVKKAPKVSVIPPARGKWLLILRMTPEEQDREILFNHVVNPKIDEDIYSAMIPVYVSAIVKAFTLLALDVSLEEAQGKTKEQLTEAEEFEYKKKLNEAKEGSSSSSTTSDIITSPSPNSLIEK